MKWVLLLQFVEKHNEGLGFLAAIAFVLLFFLLSNFKYVRFGDRTYFGFGGGDVDEDE